MVTAVVTVVDHVVVTFRRFCYLQEAEFVFYHKSIVFSQMSIPRQFASDRTTLSLAPTFGYK